MSDWPDGWTDDDQDRSGYGRGRGSATPESARVMPHVGRPPRQRSPHHDAGPTPSGQPNPGYDSGWNDGQVYRGSGRQEPPPPDAPYPYGGQGPDQPKPRPRWGRRIGFSLLALVLVLVVVGTATYFWADGKLNRDVDLEALEDRPEPGEGTNFLIVGSDSREGLSDEQREEMRTGNAEGSRTDTIMILHVGSNGNTMVSLPRDSWVTIPEFTGSESGNRIPEQGQKINAAFSIEGPWLLARTIEHNLDIHIDHYVEIGFGGFANVVDALGGVEMCFDEPIQDENSGADFAEGCHQLDGAESLAFNRQRYQEAEGDLGRTKNQQEFLGTLADQAASPGTLLNPFKLYPTMSASLDALTVDTEMSLWDLRSMFWAMRSAERMNMPVADPGYAAPDGSSAVLWDQEQADALMEQLRNDEEVTVGVE
ncbi:transcriptional attenuator, LytR family [Streptomyces zhaozhouensis]|uniref:Transcriptional attenuator, LytR family n=1 Tax=Streptomyces zhaozhouensis TaxID=1300267 RepID=A0A286E2P7_9ACTN|nr:LCP family protein [Streptomyces zhaozhouensis]SOD65165.1 transcriptional attenuator, LytR family [Streptomyces zhaozhouensis]